MSRFALLSVSDKSNLIDFAKQLIAKDFQIISTGGTNKFLSDADIKTMSVSEFTKFPEILDGRVKTLHPSIFAGLLADLEKSEHRQTLEELSIDTIDLVAVNLYPFQKTIEVSEDPSEIIENIDIGGPSLLRAAAKNAERVTVVCCPNDYELAISALEDLSSRQRLAAKVFQHTAAYDQAIADHFLTGPSAEIELAYGENPHQNAWLHNFPNDVEVLHGKTLSYNNVVDASAAIDLVSEFSMPCVAILKHTNPCGCAIADNVTQAYSKAISGDLISAFGGVVVSNRSVNKQFAVALNERFFEMLIAPDFEEDALEILKKKKNRRLIKTAIFPLKSMQVRNTHLGRLSQESDPKIELTIEECGLVSKAIPTEQEWLDLMFAWKIVKHVKSNAIVLAKDRMVVGVGAGQMSRIDALELAIRKAGEKAKGCVLASDAFFPFADAPQSAANAGISAIIQPGGSKRDQEVIDACDANHISMAFTGKRHFKH